ncbi:MAG: NADH dehydrogenase [ubiquinone] 1 alpha subcomplex assembly factor 1 [Saprospiraceae bacterium]|jgi:NADH dehydrogenase [ubiquinone] 1 alpha subcomplex assembly factor 1
MTLFDFKQDCNLSAWQVVDDRVMGGLSQGAISLNEDGNAVYNGHVTTRNNGGFSSLRCRFEEKDVSKYSKFRLKVKGDGKRYQFRVKSEQYDRHSYIHYFQTTGKMQEIEIDFADMYPTFRGRKLDMKNFSGEQIVEMAFLIGNKEEEDFVLEIDEIEVLE